MEWITLAAAIVVAIATVLYVWLTHRLLKETKRSIDETNRPEVVVFLDFVDGIPPEIHSNKEYYCKLSLCVRNVGTRAARKVKFEGDLSFQPAKGISLDRIEFMKKGIEILPPGVDVIRNVVQSDNFLDIYDPNYYQDKSSKVDICVKYQSSGGTPYDDSFTLDFLEVIN